MASKTKEKSILMTPDPYHTPGYGGFCPQFKYRIGETFGRTTAQLLTDPTVASSGRLVLAEVDPGNTNQLADERMNLIRTRTQSWGDQKLLTPMVPGYTGFVPKQQHYFGKRFAKNSRNAISDFENDQRKHNQKILDMQTTEAIQTGQLQVTEENKNRLPQIGVKFKTPLQPIAKEPAEYYSRYVPHHSMSPFYMRNDNPEKCFMSGYTGFVPHARGLIGMGYPIVTNHALNSFTDATISHEQNARKPITLEKKIVPVVNTKPIYPELSGLVPHYTGHIPGEKFRFGYTFGQSTANAMKDKPRDCVTMSI